MVISSSHTPYIVVGKKISDFCATGESYFGGAHMIFTSSQRPYILVGEKISDFGASGVILLGSIHTSYVIVVEKYQISAQKGN